MSHGASKLHIGYQRIEDTVGPKFMSHVTHVTAHDSYKSVTYRLPENRGRSRATVFADQSELA